MSQGLLHKMHVTHTSPIEYRLTLDNEILCINDYLNRKIMLQFLGEIYCIQCGRKTKQSFQQGYCFPCMQKINECNNCMIHPERCLVETGKCPTDDWAHTQCHQPHCVYLANSSGLKVGVTRLKNQPTRWIDQGAAQALPIFHTHNRHQAGLIEVVLKQFVADKTNWRKMLMRDVVVIDLIAEKKLLLSQAQQQLSVILKKYPDQLAVCDELAPLLFQYPIIEYPEKIISLSLDKTAKIEGILLGIKGQYLILSTGVLNIRKFGGYHVQFG